MNVSPLFNTARGLFRAATIRPSIRSFGDDVRLTQRRKRDATTSPQPSLTTGANVGHYDGTATRQQLIGAVVAGTVVAALVCGPIAGHGWLLLLDWIPGPNPNVPRGLFGLDGGLTSS